MATAPLEVMLSNSSPNNSRTNGGSDRGSIRDGSGDNAGRPGDDFDRSREKDGIDADPFESFLYGNGGYFDTDDFFDDDDFIVDEGSKKDEE